MQHSILNEFIVAVFDRSDGIKYSYKIERNRSIYKIEKKRKKKRILLDLVASNVQRYLELQLLISRKRMRTNWKWICLWIAWLVLHKPQVKTLFFFFWKSRCQIDRKISMLTNTHRVWIFTWVIFEQFSDKETDRTKLNKFGCII